MWLATLVNLLAQDSMQNLESFNLFLNCVQFQNFKKELHVTLMIIVANLFKFNAFWLTKIYLAFWGTRVGTLFDKSRKLISGTLVNLSIY